MPEMRYPGATDPRNVGTITTCLRTDDGFITTRAVICAGTTVNPLMVLPNVSLRTTSASMV